MRNLVLAIGVILFSAFTAIAQVPQVVQTTPGLNALNVNPAENITVTFDINMDETTFNDSTFVVFARSSGLHSGIYSYDSLDFTASFQSSDNFEMGEVVSINLTTGIKSASGTSLGSSFTWNFTILSGGGPGQFNLDQIYPVGTDPAWINSADFDNDGDLDLAIANNQSHQISILMNLGNGSFAPHQTYPVGIGPSCLVVADFENDGDIDIANTNWTSNNITVLLNDGDGTFGASTSYNVGITPLSIHTADFNGDGYMDLTTADHDNDNISVLFNNGDGTFAPHTTYYSGDRTFSVYTADFDNDGDIDICACNHDHQNVSVFLNDGNGSFSTPGSYPTGGISVGVLAADLDGDGDADIAAANFGEHEVSVLLNNGDATFLPYSSYAVDGSPRTISSADFDGDGDIDLMASHYNDGNVTLLSNDGDGTFSYYGRLYQGNRNVFAADYDGDDDLDFAVASAYDGDVLIFLNQQGVLTGIVTDLDLNPLEDVFVFTADTMSYDSTGADGQYILYLPGGYYDVTFQKTGFFDYLAENIYVGLTDTVILDVSLIEIAPPCSSCVRGIVTNIIPDQVESVYVSAEGTSIYDYTNPAGGYSLTELDPGNYNIFFSHLAYVDTTVYDVVVVFDEATNLDMVIESNSAITGVVADTGSQPIEYVAVDIPVLNLAGITDSTGEYFISGIIPGNAYDVHFSHFSYLENWLYDVIVAVNETLVLDTVYLSPIDSEVVVWYGNPDLSPVTAPIGDTILVDVWVRSEPYVGFIHLPLGTDDQYIIDHHSETEGIFYYPLSDWDDVRFLPPNVLAPGWHNQSLLGFYDIFGGPNPPLQCLEPTRIASFAFEVSDDTSLIGNTVVCLVEGYHPANGEPLFGDINGVDPYYPYQLFSPFHFVDSVSGCEYVVGDANNDSTYNGMDITYGAIYFKGGPAPPYSCECTPGNIWHVSGDVNGNCIYNGVDITYGVAYFKGGPDPIPCPDCPPVN